MPHLKLEPPGSKKAEYIHENLLKSQKILCPPAPPWEWTFGYGTPLGFRLTAVAPPRGVRLSAIASLGYHIFHYGFSRSIRL